MFSEENVALVRGLAHLIWRRYPSKEIEDLTQSGFVGLLKAEKKFDPKLGVPFSKYATTRILGEIRDDMRGGQYGIRRLSKIKRDVRAATKRIEDREKRAATSKELASEIPDYYAVSQELAGLDPTALTECVVDSNDTENAAHAAREARKLEERIDRLTPREAEAARLYYIDGIYLHEIGRRLGGVTESRASQIVSAATKKLGAVYS